MTSHAPQCIGMQLFLNLSTNPTKLPVDFQDVFKKNFSSFWTVMAPADAVYPNGLTWSHLVLAGHKYYHAWSLVHAITVILFIQST